MSYPFRVVFLHGLFGSQQEFLWYKHNIRHTSAVYSYDLPHHGKRKGEEPFSLSYLLSDLQEQLLTAQVGRVLFIGHSLGGQLALRYAALYPDAVVGICLLDIFPRWTYALQQFQTEILALLQTLELSDAPFSNAIWQNDNGRYLQKHIARRGGRIEALARKEIIRFVNNDMPQLNVAPPFSHPLLLVQGSHSPFTKGLTDDELKCAYSQISVVQIPGAGHLLHLTHRHTVGKLLQDFIVACSR